MYALSVYLENIEFVCTVPLYLMSHFSSTDPTPNLSIFKCITLCQHDVCDGPLSVCLSVQRKPLVYQSNWTFHSASILHDRPTSLLLTPNISIKIQLGQQMNLV